MKKILLLVFLFVLGKMSYSQGYPLLQNLGSDSTIVVSKGALQSRLIPIVITDTNAANAQRLKSYPGAQLYTTAGDFYIRNSNATKWILVSSGSSGSVNIYTADGTLTGNRTLTGANNNLTFTGLNKFTVSTGDTTLFNTNTFDIKGVGGVLNVEGTAAGTTSSLTLKTASDGNWTISTGQVNFNSGDLRFYDNDNGANRMIIKPSGNVGIGTETPDSLLTVNGGVYIGGGIRAPGLPTALGTKALRINAQGQISVADTTLGGGTVISVATNDGSGITGGPITVSGTLAIDTTNVIATKASVSSGLAGKLNISDTAAMLAPYLRAIDTASLSNRINLKLNISDTASMLGNYLNNVGYGLSKVGQVASADSATLSAYYLRRKDSLTTTNPLGYVTKQILADTAAAIRSSSASGFVPYTGATQNVDLGQFGLKTKYVEFDTSSQAVTDRRLQWSNDEGTLQFGMTNGATITQRIGLEQFARVKNVQGSQINKGQAVYIYGASGDRASVKLADNRADSTSSKTLGVAAEDIAINDVGLVGTFGQVGNLNLSTFSPGDILYLDSIPGQLTATKPQAPYHLVFIGVVERANSGNGLLFVNPQNGYELEELHNVRITSPVPNKAILLYDSTRRLWVDTTVATSGIAVTQVNTNAATGITGGPITTTGTIAADTLVLSTRAWRQKGVDSLQANINLKLNISDTASMLANYVNNVGYGLSKVGQVVSADSSTLSNYYLRRKDSLTSTNPLGYVTKQILADTAAAIRSADAGGTVTSVATNNGTGITGGTITTSGTLAIDTTVISTRAWRQKGIDSVASLITGSYVPLSRTLTINGTSFDLSANRTWNVGTVTTAAASGGGQVAFFNGSTVITSVTGLYFDGTNKLAIGSSSPDSMLSVTQGAHIQRGVRLSGLPTAPGTRSLRIDANGTLSVSDTLANGMSGSGTPNYIPKFTGSNSIGNSEIYENSSNIGIGTISPAQKLEVIGTLRVRSATEILDISAPLGKIDFNNVSGDPIGFSIGSSERMRLDASGNLGLGAIPSAWSLAGLSAMQIQNGGLYGYSVDEVGITSNSYYNSGWKYIANSQATQYSTFNGAHRWYTAPSGTAGNAISFTQAMTLDASGRLGIGTTSPAVKLDVNGDVNLASGYTLSWGGAYGANIPSIAGVSGVGSNIRFYPSGSTTGETMRITSAGNLGIGTTSPKTKVDILSAGGTLPTLGTNPSSANLFLTDNGLWGMYFGLENSTGKGYIQQMRNDGATSYPLLLQPVGGNVGIGTTSPGYKLDINGDLRVYNTISGSTVLWLNSANTGSTTLNFGGTTTPDKGRIVYSDFSDLFLFYTNSSERMRITSAGNVGIGTTSPAQLLHIQGSGTTYLHIGNSQTGSTSSDGFDIGYFSGETGLNIIQRENDYIAISTNNAERMRITSGGDVGIGTTTPASLLHLYKTSYPVLTIGTGTITGNMGMDTGNGYMHVGTETNHDLVFGTNNSPKMRITSGGNVGIGTSTPQTKLDIFSGSNDNFASSIGTALGIGNWSGIHFGYMEAGNFFYRKSALVFERTGSAAEGKIHILNNGTANTSNATLADARLTITPTGNVGIGTTSPSYKLDVVISSGPYNSRFHNSSTSTSDYNSILITQGAAGSATGYFGTGGSTTGNASFQNTFVVGTQTSNAFVLNTNDTERMRITSGGKVLIATTTDAGNYNLQVSGNAYFYNEITTGNPNTIANPVPWKLGSVSVVSPTSPDRTIRVQVDGVTYYIHAKTTND